MNMKSKVLSIFCACLACCGLALSFSSCNDDNVSDLKLSGDCMITQLVLDNFEGIIDLPSRTIVVRLPEIYDTKAMKVTTLKFSDGAVCNIHQGETINMDAAKVLRVKNGDTYMDWTLSALHDEARITDFVINDIYRGVIDQETMKIVVYVPASLDITQLVPTITYSANATITPSSGVPQDFSKPVTYTVTNNSAKGVYTVTVIPLSKPKALFLGSAATLNELDPEAKAACQWMLSNVPGTLYASFADLRANTLDLSECEIMWWHWHVDGGVDGHDNFVAKGADAMNTLNELRQFYENGGALLLTRYATNIPSFIGVTGDDEWTTPNNCWGQDEDKAELCNAPWTFRKFEGQEGHAIYSDLVAGDNPNEVYCTDNGYHITNSTAQYHIGIDWGDYPHHDAWVNRTGGKILGVGGDGAIVLWEYPAREGKGGIICIGSGCYDWYSYTYEAGYTEKYHKNIEIMTKNAINYLTK